MESEGSLPHSKALAICPYPELEMGSRMYKVFFFFNTIY